MGDGEILCFEDVREGVDGCSAGDEEGRGRGYFVVWIKDDGVVLMDVGLV